MMRLKEKFGGVEGKKRLDSWLELEAAGELEVMVFQQFGIKKTPEAIACQQLDKMDRAVQALIYEKDYDNVQNFFPYTIGKLTDPSFVKILEILLKRQYPEINPYDQYFTLLACDGDEEIFTAKMEILNKQK